MAENKTGRGIGVTIRKRLFISNLLMIIIPVVLSMMLIGGLYLLLTGALAADGEGRLPHPGRMYQGMQQADDMAGDFERKKDLAELKEDMARLNYKHGGKLVATLYQNGQPVYPEGEAAASAALDLVLQMENGSYIIANGSSAYVTGAGEYRLVVSEPVHEPNSGGVTSVYRQYMYGAGNLAFLLFIGVILCTNTLLTRRMYKSIMVPLNALVTGVHEIRDGNLEYRIPYAGRDEFGAVAQDFNEMAGYLQDMVNARLRDNENRKELVAGISHDLRTPLTSIIAYVEGLETGVASTPALQRKYFETIKHKTQDLEHIVSQLFLFSKLDVGDFPLRLEAVRLAPLLAAFVEGAAEEYRGKGLALSFRDEAGSEVWVQADEVQLRAVLTNVLENTVKYGGGPDARVDITLGAEGGQAVLALADNGPGVPEEALSRLFDVFYRRDAARNDPGRGSGLGLAISAKIIEGFGGSIEAQNVPDGGLAIIIRLPVGGRGEAGHAQDIDH